VFLISVKLISMSYKNSLMSATIPAKLDGILAELRTRGNEATPPERAPSLPSMPGPAPTTKLALLHDRETLIARRSLSPRSFRARVTLIVVASHAARADCYAERAHRLAPFLSVEIPIGS
jgi:hypothetical protein